MRQSRSYQWYSSKVREPATNISFILLMQRSWYTCQQHPILDPIRLGPYGLYGWGQFLLSRRIGSRWTGNTPGLLWYYSKYLPNLSSVLSPLYRMLCKDVHWEWEATAFEHSKELLTSHLSLYTSTLSYPCVGLWCVQGRNWCSAGTQVLRWHEATNWLSLGPFLSLRKTIHSLRKMNCLASLEWTSFIHT